MNIIKKAKTIDGMELISNKEIKLLSDLCQTASDKLENYLSWFTIEGQVDQPELTETREKIVAYQMLRDKLQRILNQQ